MAQGRQHDEQRDPFVDQFGMVLVAVAVTIALLLLVDVSRRFGDTTAAEVAVTALTGATLVLALLAAGVSRLLVRIAAAVALLLVGGALVSMFTDVSITFYGLLWFLLVVTTPFIVLPPDRHPRHGDQRHAARCRQRVPVDRDGVHVSLSRRRSVWRWQFLR